jgi:hypothetical protein
MTPTPRTAAQLELNFTKEEGLVIQSRHLKEFKSILIEPAFEVLEKLVTVKNKDAYDGFDLIRGTEIDEILHNQVIPFFCD